MKIKQLRATLYLRVSQENKQKDIKIAVYEMVKNLSRPNGKPSYKWVLKSRHGLIQPLSLSNYHLQVLWLFGTDNNFNKEKRSILYKIVQT